MAAGDFSLTHLLDMTSPVNQVSRFVSSDQSVIDFEFQTSDKISITMLLADFVVDFLKHHTVAKFECKFTVQQLGFAQ